MNTNLVEVVNEQVLTTSRKVAETFGKEHKNVLQSIDNLVAENPATKNFFYEDAREYRGQTFRYFTMNRDGFSLLVMGFTGKEALDWKLKYIAAFNTMEEELRNRKQPITQLPIQHAMKDVNAVKESIKQMFAVKDGMALAAAMEMCGKYYGVNMKPLERLLPAENKPCRMNATELAKKANICTKKGKPNAAAVNLMLAGLGLQEKSANGEGWRLTEAGKAYAEELPYINHGHAGYRTLWDGMTIALLLECGKA